MRPSWDPIRTLLGRSWGSLGGSWALLGRSWGTLGRSWGALKATKNEKNTDSCLPCCFLAAFGPVLAPLGLILVPPGLILRALWQYFGTNHCTIYRHAYFVKLCNEWYQSLQRFTSSLGLKLPPGFQERGWESLSTFRLDWLGICWELGVPAPGSNRLGPPWVRRSPRSGLQLIPLINPIN